jgi:hypothetical protein
MNFFRLFFLFCGCGAAQFQQARIRSFREKFSEKMKHMTPEAKEKFNSHMCL